MAKLDKLTIYLPPEILQEIKASARENKVSVSKYCLERLRDTEHLDTDTIHQHIDSIHDEVEQLRNLVMTLNKFCYEAYKRMFIMNSEASDLCDLTLQSMISPELYKALVVEVNKSVQERFESFFDEEYDRERILLRKDH